MLVELIAHTPEALKIAFTAIRTCYSPYSHEQIMEDDYIKYKNNNNDDIRLVKQIVNHGHTSTLEHISFTFAIENVSRSLLAQLTRHRIGFSYSVQSQRYVKMESGSKNGRFAFITPPSVKKDKALNNIYLSAMRDIQNAYDILRRNGISAEDARMVLPNGASTNITMTVNLRALMDFYNKRNQTTHSQWEIAELAEKLREEVITAEPWTEELFNL